MNAHELRAARLSRSWTQKEAASRLGVSQPYLAMLERGRRPLAPSLALRAAKLYGLSPMVVPRLPQGLRTRLDAATLARDLAGLGYPGLAYLRPRSWTPKNPGDVLLIALAHDDLEARLVEALPWLVLRYCTLDWSWVVPAAKTHDLQNRLGFVVNLARGLAERSGDQGKARTLADLESQLEHSRLAREDTLCRASLPEAERGWLAEHRSDAARHWNLLTDWTVEALRYVA